MRFEQPISDSSALEIDHVRPKLYWFS